MGRETSGRAFIPQIDGLRFFAIAAVMAMHFSGEYQDALHGAHDSLLTAAGQSWVSTVASIGWIGVPLFFAVSGFVLAMPFGRHHLLGAKHVDLRTYFVRRVMRIEPPFVINLLVLFFAAVFIWHWPDLRGLARHLMFSLTYLHGAWYHQRSTVSGVTWSLEVEVQFYLLAPALTTVFRLRPKWLRRAVIGGAMIGFAALRPHLRASAQGLTLAHQFHFFLAGFLLVDLYLLDWNRPARQPLAWDLAALAGWATLLLILLKHANYQYATPWLTVVIYAAAFRGRWWPWIVSRPFVYLIDGMCYTLYLYHWWIGNRLIERTVRWHVGSNYSINCAAQILLVSVVTLGICTVLFALLEKPFMRRDWVERSVRLLTRRAGAPVQRTRTAPVNC